MAPVTQTSLVTTPTSSVINSDDKSSIKPIVMKIDESKCLIEFRSLLTSKTKLRDYDLDDEIILKFLRSRDYDLRESHKVLSGFISILEDRPDIFAWSDSIKKVISSDMYYHYPVKTPNGCKLLISHPGRWDTRSFNIETIITTTLFFDEVSLLDKQVQENGFIGIIDMRGLGWSQIYNVGITNAKLASDLTDKYIPFKLINLHVIYENRLTNLAYSLFKPFLDEKLKNRIIFHGHNLTSLYNYVPKSCLPASLGGTNIDYPWDHYNQQLESKKDQVLELWELMKKKRINNN
ncbi:alpha-tocopherol transfer protein-like [Panonychus citri]|uniref:alpha-tocopherol transfer protein-like n=1 Tax=Panonychus citri TaxID=50023 RepID=UPI002306E027|nr:alpha-tocopherol transfer protein-like [Panonychus citri]XP_053208716.1 alpha-tocopherol transfer protein-like [Panonychus citri]